MTEPGIHPPTEPSTPASASPAPSAPSVPDRKGRPPLSAKLLFQLFWSTFSIGAVTFGGGYAMVSVMDKKFVEDHHWISEEEMMDLLAIAEMTPGPIAINASTYVGTKMAGLPGAIAATLGMVLPSFFFITLLSSVYLQFKENPTVAAALLGIRAGVVALVLSAVFKLGKKAVKKPMDWAICLLAFAAAGLLDLSAIAVILAAGATGLALRRKEVR
ncbi:MAG: chromate transporter [Clostridia bacterium]|nr:chromate transporter [Clostridia bacterium]